MAGETPVRITAAPEQLRRVDRLDEVVRDLGVDVGHAGDVHDDDLGAAGANCVQELLGELPGPSGVDDADYRQDEQTLAHLEDRRGELTDRFLLLPHHFLALFDEGQGDDGEDLVGDRLVDVQGGGKAGLVALIAFEEAAAVDVAEGEQAADDLLGGHAAQDAALGHARGVLFGAGVLAGVQAADAGVVDIDGLRFDLLRRQAGEKALCRHLLYPLPSQRLAFLAKVRN